MARRLLCKARRAGLIAHPWQEVRHAKAFSTGGNLRIISVDISG
jgi:hypothetical protein